MTKDKREKYSKTKRQKYENTTKRTQGFKAIYNEL